MNKYLFLGLFILFNFRGLTQSLTNDELHLLHSTISLFIQNHEPKSDFKERNSEFIFCILSINVNGKIERIQLLSDENNKDSTYKYLTQLQINDFHEAIFENCKSKTIMIPIISFSSSDNSIYIQSIINFYKRMPRTIINETKNLVLSSLLEYDTPHIIKESPEEKKIYKAQDD